MAAQKRRKRRPDSAPPVASQAAPPDPAVSADPAVAAQDPHAAPAPRALQIGIVIGVLSLAAVLLFARLGHYSLWDDESFTALPALNLWRVGDTSLVFGKNIMAYRDGTMMTNFHERTYQPLMFCIAAPSLGLLGETALAARLPFALCGLACVALMLRWAWREQLTSTTWLLLALALLGNVSFFLYSRQCRYYAPTILLSVAIAYVYRFYDGSRRSVVILAILSWLLMINNLLNYVPLYLMLTVDYALWGRKRQAFRLGDLLWLFLPQVVLGAPVLAVFNPWNSQVFEFPHESWIGSKATLFYRSVRDMNRCEFGVLPLIGLAPLLYFRVGWPWLLRAPLALLVGVAAVTIMSPQPVGMTTTADVRYLAWLIPLCMAIGVLALAAICSRHVILALLLGGLAFGTNAFHLDYLAGGRPRSSVVDFIGELWDPPGDPYTVAAAWIKGHVKPGESICVLPSYMNYPLIFHAPGPLYAWQLPPGSEDRYPGLDPLHFRGKVAPEYFLTFGPSAEAIMGLTRAESRIRYQQIDTLDFFWRDMHRPELMWRTFKPITGYPKNRDAIYVFQRADSALPTALSGR
jgi:hypothetical protein